MLLDPGLNLFNPHDRTGGGEHYGGDVLDHLFLSGNKDLVCLALLQLLGLLIGFLKKTTDQVGRDMKLLGDVLV